MIVTIVNRYIVDRWIVPVDVYFVIGSIIKTNGPVSDDSDDFDDFETVVTMTILCWKYPSWTMVVVVVTDAILVVKIHHPLPVVVESHTKTIVPVSMEIIIVVVGSHRRHDWYWWYWYRW